MNNINIKCSTGFTLPLTDINIYPNKLKKHSMLEIERIVDSIEKDGFLFPITIGKVGGKNYIIDGEATFSALQELKYRGFEIPEIPVYFVKCNKDTIKKMILIATSTNHCVIETSLKKFVENTDIDLKECCTPMMNLLKNMINALKIKLVIW